MKFQLASLDNQNVLLGPEPKYIVNSFVCVEAGVDERLTPRPPDLEVRGSSLARRVVSSDKELYFSFSLFTQVF